jgi:thermostable hemolysin
MDAWLAERGSPEWQAAADLVRRRYAEEYGADYRPDPDNYLILRAATGTIVGCAGLTYHSDRPFVAELCAGQSVEELCKRYLGIPVDPAEVVEVGQGASAGLDTGGEIGRLAPIIAWTQGMRYVVCVTTHAVRSAFEYMGVPFTPMVDASDHGLTEAEQVNLRVYFATQKPVVGVIPLDSMGGLMRKVTGRYRFTNIRLSRLGNSVDDE